MTKLEAATKERPAKLRAAAGKLISKLPGTGKKRWILPIAVVLILLLAVSMLAGGGKNASPESAYLQTPPERRSIVSTLRGSGTLKPANSYTVTTLLQGEILSDSFEEGDVVEKETVLYELDSSDAVNNIERAQLTLDQAQRGYGNAMDRMTVKAEISGSLYQLNVGAGDSVTAGQTLGVVRSSDTMKLVVPFSADDAQTFSVGQAATVTLDSTFETLPGTVEAISGSDMVGAGNMITRNVTIVVKNPGGLSSSQAATAGVNGIQCAGSGTFAYQAEQTLLASASGTVTAVNVPEGGDVTRGQVILTLGGSDMNDQLQSAAENLRGAQLSMDTTTKQLEAYTIESPISGTIVEKQYKAGDTVEAGKPLCVIYDLSYLEMTLNVDELDISYIEVGQKVQITADAVEGKTYEGEITKVSVAGTTANGGGTSYPVTIRINETDGLLPGMNADAEIILKRADDALSVPNSAIQRGGLVLITADSPSAGNAVEAAAPEGYVYVPVETGVSDSDHTQITAGLQEGDIVAYIPVTVGAPMDLGGFD